MSEEKKIFSEIRTQRVSHLIEKQLKQAIFEKHFKIGDKIPSERELVESFHASRSSVREALRSLEKSGFVVIKKGAQGGAYVRQNDTKPVVDSLKDMLRLKEVSLEEIRQVRLVLEPILAAEAALKATAKDIERLEETRPILQEAYRSGDPVIENNPRFHILIADISENRVFKIIMKVLMDIYSYRMRNIKLDEKAKKTIIRQHDKIIEAIKKKDKEMAFENMRRHIIKVQKELSDSEKVSGE